MAFITITSDYGNNSPYSAAVKGAIYTQLPSAQIVDISNMVTPYNVLQAAYLLKQVVWHYPLHSIHLICLDTNFAANGQYIIAESDGQYFIGADNGIFSLLFEKTPANFYIVKKEFVNEDDLFPEKNLFTFLAIQLINGLPVTHFSEAGEIRNIKQSLMPVKEDSLIRGNIVFVDGFDNAITNISKTLFEEKLATKTSFKIFFSRKLSIDYISKNYNDAKEGSELALFNESGFLEIAMNAGNAGQLLGLKTGASINIEFYD
ncbi:MAG: SAM-dependent chlorinase/fluorinase [Bacteroidota bacterium]